MSEDWRKDLNFSTRLSSTAKMQVSAFVASDQKNNEILANTETSATAYGETSPGKTRQDISQYAKATEIEARKTAHSIADYHALIEKTIRALLASGTVAPDEDKCCDENVAQHIPHHGASIGRFYNAQHYKDGLFSQVYKALSSNANESQQSEAQLVALKVTTPAMMTPPHDSYREARILRAVNCDSIIPLLDAFEQTGGRYVLAFPFMPYDLETVLQRRQLTDQARRAILRDLFGGLSRIHALNMLHRDIKPSNILLKTPTGPAYIADFGIAWSDSDASSEAADSKILDVGTTCYRAPELLFGYQSYGEEVDMWAAGCVAAQVVCLNDKTLFDAGDLGSELALIKSIFETLGTPSLGSWPVSISQSDRTSVAVLSRDTDRAQDAALLPDWGKMNFKSYTKREWVHILPDAQANAVKLVENLVTYPFSQRLSAAEALKQEYLL